MRSSAVILIIGSSLDKERGARIATDGASERNLESGRPLTS